MLKAVLLCLGLVIGFFAGLFSADLLDTRTSKVPKTDRTDSAYSEAFFLCKSEEMAKPLQLQINSDWRGARTIVFPFKAGPGIYRVVETTDLHYAATEEEPEAPDAVGSIEISRVSGQMTFTSRVPAEAVRLFVDICDKRIPGNECRPRIDRIKGGNWVNCIGLVNDVDCPKWRSGSNISGRYRFQCEKIERRF